jgi:hypothetical protein
MGEGIFLSASVPDERRAPEYAATSDSIAITAAVAALVHVVLGRRLLVWGGHPAITPMIWTVAEDFRVDYGSWVRLYQSFYFRDEFPEDNERFKNVTFTDVIDKDRAKSLRHMRERMFSEHAFQAAVFIGGMSGIVEEFKLFTAAHPRATVLPILSTGGAVLVLAERLQNVDPELSENLDYIDLLHKRLGISPREERFVTPAEQPARVEDRYWKGKR